MRTTTHRTAYRRVKVYALGRDNQYGPTKEGNAVLRIIRKAAQAGNTVSMREYVEDHVKYMDAEILWDAEGETSC